MCITSSERESLTGQIWKNVTMVRSGVTTTETQTDKRCCWSFLPAVLNNHSWQRRGNRTATRQEAQQDNTENHFAWRICMPNFRAYITHKIVLGFVNIVNHRTSFSHRKEQLIHSVSLIFCIISLFKQMTNVCFL